MKVCDEWCGNKTSFVLKEIFKGINKKTEITTYETKSLQN